MFFKIDNHSDYVKNCLVTGAIVLAVMHVFNRPVVHEPASELSSNGQERIVVQAGEYQSYYKLGSQINEPLLVTTIYPQRSRTNPLEDFHSQFVTFSPKATRSYMKKYAGMTHCPASFLNSHADHISLYASNLEVAKKLANWKQKNGSEVSSWEVMNISGQCMGKRTKIEKNGEDVTKSTRLITLGRKASRDCHMIYVTGIEQTETTLQDYMRG